MKKPIKYVEVYLSNGVLKETLHPSGYVIGFFFFWMFPIFILVNLVMLFFDNNFWIKEEDYYKEKLKELKDKG